MQTTQKSTQELRLLLSACKSAKALGICEKTLWNVSEPRGDLPVVRIGRRTLYSVDDLHAWIQRHKTGGASDDS